MGVGCFETDLSYDHSERVVHTLVHHSISYTSFKPQYERQIPASGLASAVGCCA